MLKKRILILFALFFLIGLNFVLFTYKDNEEKKNNVNKQEDVEQEDYVSFADRFSLCSNLFYYETDYYDETDKKTIGISRYKFLIDNEFDVDKQYSYGDLGLNENEKIKVQYAVDNELIYSCCTNKNKNKSEIWSVPIINSGNSEELDLKKKHKIFEFDKTITSLCKKEDIIFFFDSDKQYYEYDIKKNQFIYSQISNEYIHLQKNIEYDSYWWETTDSGYILLCDKEEKNIFIHRLGTKEYTVLIPFDELKNSNYIIKNGKVYYLLFGQGKIICYDVISKKKDTIDVSKIYDFEKNSKVYFRLYYDQKKLYVYLKGKNECKLFQFDEQTDSLIENKMLKKVYEDLRDEDFNICNIFNNCVFYYVKGYDCGEEITDWNGFDLTNGDTIIKKDNNICSVFETILFAPSSLG